MPIYLCRIHVVSLLTYIFSLDQVLRKAVEKCLHECNRLGAKSISIPSIGAGNLKYPDDVVAKCLLEVAADYLCKNKGKTSLQLVHFVIFDTKIFQTFQQFKEGDSSYSGNDTPYAIIASTPKRPTDTGATKRRGPTDTQSMSKNGGDDKCCFALPHNLRLEVVQGDITNEQLDVIVNTTNSKLKLVGGGVAGALLKKGGPALQAICDSVVAQGASAGEGRVVETRCSDIGQLKCKSIFHIVFEGGDQKRLIKTISACLEKAEKMKYRSIAFPAIGTGIVSYPPAQAADAVVKALKQFTKNKPEHLKVIRMVLFQAPLYLQFTEAFKRMGESSEGFLSYINRAFHAVSNYIFSSNDEEEVGEEERGENQEENFDDLVDNEDERAKQILANLSLESEVIIRIYGQTDQSVKRAEKQLRAIIDTRFVTEEIDNPGITRLSHDNINDLEDFAKSHTVDIIIDCDPSLHFIRIHGCQSDVLMVKDKVRDVLADINEEKTIDEVADVMFKHIRWMRQVSEEMDNYDKNFNYEIERAYQQDKKVYNSTDEAEKFTIDFGAMEEQDLDTGDVVKVMRVNLLEGNYNNSNWFFVCPASVNLIFTFFH